MSSDVSPQSFRSPESTQRASSSATSPASTLATERAEKAAPRNIELPPNAHGSLTQYSTKYNMPVRPGYNKSGREVVVGVNAFSVPQLPTQKVHQYDVLIGSGTEKRGLIKAIWESPSMQSALGPHWLFDGNRIAWSGWGIHSLKGTPIDRQHLTIKIDMDQERGDSAPKAQNEQTENADGQQGQSARRSNVFRVQIRYATTVNLSALDAYLNGKMAFDDSVLEAISFLSHLLRHNPSKALITIKNSFFPKNWSDACQLSNGLFATKGIFQSIRAAHGGRMIVNVDVSHAVFLKNQRMDHVAAELVDCSSPTMMISHFQKDQKDPPHGSYRDSPLMDRLRRLRKVGFTVVYRGVNERIKGKRWIVKEVMYTNARNTFFTTTDKETGHETRINVEDYFKKQYGIKLDNPLLPLVETTKKGIYYPMEVCHINQGEKWPFKLNERQTADMIKFAVSRPEIRMNAIQKGLSALGWKNDQTMKSYGLQIADRMIDTKARLLTAPKVMFRGNAVENPGTTGRWRIDKKQFYKPNAVPLEFWGVCLITTKRGSSASQPEVMNFLNSFKKLYREHGGNFKNESPSLYQGSDTNAEAAVDGIHAAVMRKSNGKRPQFVLFVLPRKDTILYHQLKRYCDLKYGFLSQMVQSAQVQKSNPQYIGNVLMKVNAKLGGASFKAMPIQGPVADRKGVFFTKPTLVIGADVSHPAPGTNKPSYAAVTVSMDKEAIRYGAAVQSNGHRLEMITAWNWRDMLTPLIREWSNNLCPGKLPKHLIYFRDGVSEGQYQHVLQQEVRDIRNVIRDIDTTPNKLASKELKFTVVIVSKRHHIRLFPKPGPGADRNKNPHPGTLVERDVTSPHEYDFYLNSHSAIQGTARPSHYTVLMDEENMGATMLQNMIYEHCYQYIRSSTPVSIYPAVYYAHLASKRAAAHERSQQGPLNQHRTSDQRERERLIQMKDDADRTGAGMAKEAVEKLKQCTNEEYPPLVPSVNNRIWAEMWYI